MDPFDILYLEKSRCYNAKRTRIYLYYTHYRELYIIITAILLYLQINDSQDGSAMVVIE